MIKNIRRITVRWIAPLLFVLAYSTFSLSATASYVTLTGTFVNAQGSPLNGRIVLRPPFAGLTTLEGSVLSPTPISIRISNGSIFGSSAIIPNDDILPQRTYYSYSLYDSSDFNFMSGNVYISSTNGTFNLGAAILSPLTTSNVSIAYPLNGTIITVIPGETIAHAYSRVPVGGGLIQLSGGIVQSGGVTVNTPNITIQGVGAPGYNSPTSPTALNSFGTIVQGPIIGIQGADALTVRDLGADCGSAWSAANGNTIPGACVGIFNNGQVIGAPVVQNPLFSNITCLGIATNTAAHCLIQENVSDGVIENSRSFFMTHGMVQKGFNNTMRGVWGRGHASDCFIFKSDVYAPGGNWTLSDFNCAFGTALGDTHGVVVQANNGGNVQKIQINTGVINGVTNAGILLWGVDNADQLLQVTISSVNIDILNTSGACLINQGWVSDVNMGTFTCFNSASGGILNQSIGTQNDFRYSNGTIGNITGIGLDTIGRTSVSNVAFINVSGNAIQTENGGITTQCNTLFSGVGAGLAVVGSGSYKFCGDASEDVLGDITFQLGLGPGKSAIASFPACSSALEGNHLIATTCNAGCVAGNTCTTGGATHCEMYCNSSPAWVETGR